VPGRLRQMDTQSTASFRLLRRWLNVCNHDHRCIPPNTLLPDRVLEVLDAQGMSCLKLEEPNGTVEQYIALSHCWGNTAGLRTLNSNVDAFKESIEFNKLPKTFKDAVIITRELGIRYLWIDSLCIIQDSEQDWFEQSARMGEVYSGAWLTISASASTSTDSGCFVPRPPIYSSPESEYCHARDTRPDALATAVVCLTSGINSKLYFFPESRPPYGIHQVHTMDPLRYDAVLPRMDSSRACAVTADDSLWHGPDVLGVQ